MLEYTKMKPESSTKVEKTQVPSDQEDKKIRTY